MVMVKCPQTGHAIPTGIKTDRESFAAQPGVFRAHPLSDLPHRSRWFAREAWVNEPSARTRRVASSARGIDHQFVDDRDGGTPWRICKSPLKRPAGCCRPGTFWSGTRLKPGPARNELRQTAKVLRELAEREAQANPATSP